MLTMALFLSGGCWPGSGQFGGTAANVSPSAGVDCQSFAGETVRAVAWSTGGDFLAVSTSVDSDSQGRVRVFEWPSMEIATEAPTDVLAADYVAVDAHGAVYWISWDPMADQAVARQLWTVVPGEAPRQVGGPLRSGPFFGLAWSGGRLIAKETDHGPPERSRLVSIDVLHPTAQFEVVTGWRAGLMSSFWADRTGDWLLWDENAGGIQHVVVQHEDRERVARVPDGRGRHMSLSPDRRAVIYQDVSTAKLMVLDLESGQIVGELSPREFNGGEVSSRDILAGATAYGLGEANELCVLNVHANLEQLSGK